MAFSVAAISRHGFLKLFGTITHNSSQRQTDPASPNSGIRILTSGIGGGADVPTAGARVCRRPEGEVRRTGESRALSLRTLLEKLNKISAKVVKHSGHFMLQLAEVAILDGSIHGLRSALDIGPEPRAQSRPTRRQRPTEG